MPTKIDQRRLRDGTKGLNMPQSKTSEELLAERDQVLDSLRAMQSLDDLGSPEANKGAWKDCLRLGRRLNRINRDLKKVRYWPL